MMDTLPRVPDVNGTGAGQGVVDEKLYSDLYTRTSWVDASIALDQIEKVRERLRMYKGGLLTIFSESISIRWGSTITTYIV